jgi:hypothetical protein
MLSSGAKVIIWDKMLSSGAYVISVSSGANVIIWCNHVMLSSGMITHPFLFFLKTSLTQKIFAFKGTVIWGGGRFIHFLGPCPGSLNFKNQF